MHPCIIISREIRESFHVLQTEIFYNTVQGSQAFIPCGHFYNAHNQHDFSNQSVTWKVEKEGIKNF